MFSFIKKYLLLGMLFLVFCGCGCLKVNASSPTVDLKMDSLDLCKGKEDVLSEKVLYKKLSQLGRSKSSPKILIPKVAEYIDHPSPKVKAKVLWLLGELGLKDSKAIAPYVVRIADELISTDAKLRERAVGALGRIGRGDFKLVKPYIAAILRKAEDLHPNVRMNFIWACENIATTAPDAFASSMEIFARLLDDAGIRVRREAPEIFRVLGKRRPDLVEPYISKLTAMSKADSDAVVRIHSAGAIKASIV